jgi:hypothetical protein
MDGGTNLHNYFVFIQDVKDEKDGIMIGFRLVDYPSFGAFLHLDEISEYILAKTDQRGHGLFLAE